jgi:hypothetical protein
MTSCKHFFRWLKHPADGIQSEEKSSGKETR